MRLSRPVGLLLFLASARAAAAGGPHPGSSVSLEPLEAGPGTISFLVRSPYAGRPFALEAPGPDGSVLRIASGTTDARGQGAVTIQVREGDHITDLNGLFFASVEVGEGVLAASPMVGLRVGRAGSGPSGGAALAAADLLPPGGDIAAAITADLDGDGDEDLLAAGTREGAAFIDIHANDGAGGLEAQPDPALEDGVPAQPRALAAADADGDGDLDVFAGTGAADIADVLLVNDGEGGFSIKEGFPSKGPEGTQTNAGLFADLDGDGDADLFVANGITGSHGVEAVLQEDQLLLNDGDGGFAPSSAFVEQAWPPSVSRGAAAGDIDLDGDLDLLVAMAGPNLLLTNDGSAAFEDGSWRLPPAADSTYGAAFADADGDGDLDVLLASAAFSPFTQTLLVNSGGAQDGDPGTFEPGEFPALAAGQSPVRLGLQVVDVDADGDPDLMFAVHELGAAERPDLYVNQGGAQEGVRGEFLLDTSFPLATGVYPSLPIADMDGDGDLDVLALPSAGASERRLFENQLFIAPDAPLGFQRGEVNGDLVMDVSDPIALLGYLFSGGDEPPCLLAGDANDDQEIDLSDAVSILNYLFSGGPAPAAPFPGFGDDPTPGSGLGCGRFTAFESIEVRP